jgi:hypothetical protein
MTVARTAITANDRFLEQQKPAAAVVSTIQSRPSTYDQRSFRAADVRSAVAGEPRRHTLN